MALRRADPQAAPHARDTDTACTTLLLNTAGRIIQNQPARQHNAKKSDV